MQIATPIKQRDYLANTHLYFVEYMKNHLFIIRYADGHCKMLKKVGIKGDFKECLSTHLPDQVIKVFLVMVHSQNWSPLYKPNNLRTHINKIISFENEE